MLTDPVWKSNGFDGHGRTSIESHASELIFPASRAQLATVSRFPHFFPPGDRPPSANFGTTSLRNPACVHRGGRCGQADSAYVRQHSFSNGAWIFTTVLHSCAVAADSTCTITIYVARCIEILMCIARCGVPTSPTFRSLAGVVITERRKVKGLRRRLILVVRGIIFT